MKYSGKHIVVLESMYYIAISLIYPNIFILNNYILFLLFKI